jgi:hypothetical protein
MIALREGVMAYRNKTYIAFDGDNYTIPDNRVGNIAFDVSLTRKTLSTAQVRGFFSSDFRPNTVIIVRPSQLGSQSTYAIVRPR